MGEWGRREAGLVSGAGQRALTDSLTHPPTHPRPLVNDRLASSHSLTHSLTLTHTHTHSLSHCSLLTVHSDLLTHSLCHPTAHRPSRPVPGSWLSLPPPTARCSQLTASSQRLTVRESVRAVRGGAWWCVVTTHGRKHSVSSLSLTVTPCPTLTHSLNFPQTRPCTQSH